MGPIDDVKIIDHKKIVHIGEEVADVAIYSIRLADLSGLDLAAALKFRVDAGNSSSIRGDNDSVETGDVYFGALERLKTVSEKRSLRVILFDIQAQLGLLSSAFGRYSESECLVRLPLWRAEDKHVLVSSLAEIIIKLTEICTFVGLKCGSCISDKIRKNEAKYPKEVVKGSAAKYNEYHDAKRTPLQEASRTNQEVTAWGLPNTVVTLFGTAIIAVLFAFRRRSY